ncbi:UNVERIFIED_CONTAM: hypothetical protein RMT77_000642 [Armadillidium vulgare]
MKDAFFLTDFDFNVKMSISSSNNLRLNEPYLSLFLRLQPQAETNKNLFKTLHIEMNKDQLKIFIQTLKEARISHNKAIS